MKRFARLALRLLGALSGCLFSTGAAAQAQSTLQLQNSLDGSIGLLRVSEAGSADPGTFRLSLFGSYFRGSDFLCDGSNCPAPQPDDTPAPDRARRSGLHLGISATLLRFLEAYAAMHSYSTANDQGTPRLLQALGDVNLGLKAFTPHAANRIFSFGAAAELWLLNGTGSVGLDGRATSAALRGLATLDLTNRLDGGKRIPLRAHANLGYFLNNSGRTVSDAERQQNGRISRIQRFGLDIDRTDSLLFGIGVEGAFRVVRPFLEWTVDMPLNRQGYVCNVTQAASRGDGCLDTDSGFSTTPSRLSLGARVYPWRPNLAFMAALDVGTGATQDFIEEVAPELPWNAYLAIAYAVATEPRVEVVERAAEERIVKGPVPYIQGVVVDRDSGTPIADASLRFEGRQLTGLISMADGSFRTPNLEPGTYTLAVSAPGYRASTCSATLTSAVNERVKCALDPLPKVGNVLGGVVDAETNAAIASAKVRITDKLNRELELTADATGAFRFENVPPGTVCITVDAPGYLPSVTELEIEPREDVKALISVNKRPAQPNIVVTPRELKLRRQVHFQTDSAEILPDSLAILEELADVLQKRPEIRSVEVQGHTDNRGTPAYNLRLSQERAEAVVAQLQKLGIDPARLEAKGYGQDKPLVANSSEANRARNRRVQVIIKNP